MARDGTARNGAVRFVFQFVRPGNRLARHPFPENSSMPRVLNIGSMNIDYVYAVPHFVQPGETLAATGRALHEGGKGLNQSVAMARAGLEVEHAGLLGIDGVFLKDFLADQGVKVDAVGVSDTFPSGHTIIQVSPDGENSILYFPGTNRMLEEARIDELLSGLPKGDFVVLQNEVNDVALWVEKALERDLRVVLNPAPYTAEIARLPLNRLHALIVNRTEGRGLLEDFTKSEAVDSGATILGALADRFIRDEPASGPVLILTEGSEGVSFKIPGEAPRHFPVFPVTAVDTTGAGDTFAGYAVKALIEGVEKGKEALLEGIARATLAAALSVTKHGAAASIPTADEVARERLARIEQGEWPVAG